LSHTTVSVYSYIRVIRRFFFGTSRFQAVCSSTYMVMLLNTMTSILNFLLVLTKTAARSRLWSNLNLKMTAHWFGMWSYRAAPFGRADLARRKLDIRFDRVQCLLHHKAFVEFDPCAAYDAPRQQ
jgi:hypothetical protein